MFKQVNEPLLDSQLQESIWGGKDCLLPEGITITEEGHIPGLHLTPIEEDASMTKKESIMKKRKRNIGKGPGQRKKKGIGIEGKGKVNLARQGDESVILSVPIVTHSYIRIEA